MALSAVQVRHTENVFHIALNVNLQGRNIYYYQSDILQIDRKIVKNMQLSRTHA